MMPRLSLSLPSAHGVIMNTSHYHSSPRAYIVCLVAFKIECTHVQLSDVFKFIVIIVIKIFSIGLLTHNYVLCHRICF